MNDKTSEKKKKGGKVSRNEYLPADLVALREARGLSQAAMARELETSASTYRQWEAGKRRVPGLAVVAVTALGKLHRLTLDLAVVAAVEKYGPLLAAHDEQRARRLEQRRRHLGATP